MSRKFIISEQERNNILKLHKLLNESYGDKVEFNNLEVGKYYAVYLYSDRIHFLVFIEKIENTEVTFRGVDSDRNDYEFTTTEKEWNDVYSNKFIEISKDDYDNLSSKKITLKDIEEKIKNNNTSNNTTTTTTTTVNSLGCKGDCQNGDGELKSEEGYYTGNFENGKFEGKGTLSNISSEAADEIYISPLRPNFHDDQFTYKGNFINGFPEGNGKIDFDNGDKYEGEFYRGKIDGKGTMTFQNGSVYTGEFETIKVDDLTSTYKVKTIDKTIDNLVKYNSERPRVTDVYANLQPQLRTKGIIKSGTISGVVGIVESSKSFEKPVVLDGIKSVYKSEQLLTPTESNKGKYTEVNVKINNLDAPSIKYEVKTNLDGEFKFDDVEYGNYEISVSGNILLFKQKINFKFNLNSDDKDFTIVLPKRKLIPKLKESIDYNFLFENDELPKYKVGDKFYSIELSKGGDSIFLIQTFYEITKIEKNTYYYSETKFIKKESTTSEKNSKFNSFENKKIDKVSDDVFTKLKVNVENNLYCKSGDCKNGEGQAYDLYGNYYYGSFVNNIPKGEGYIQFNDKTSYRGNNENMSAMGKGTYYSKNGCVFSGEWDMDELVVTDDVNAKNKTTEELDEYCVIKNKEYADKLEKEKEEKLEKEKEEKLKNQIQRQKNKETEKKEKQTEYLKSEKGQIEACEIRVKKYYEQYIAIVNKKIDVKTLGKSGVIIEKNKILDCYEDYSKKLSRKTKDYINQLDNVLPLYEFLELNLQIQENANIYKLNDKIKNIITEQKEMKSKMLVEKELINKRFDFVVESLIERDGVGNKTFLLELQLEKRKLIKSGYDSLMVQDSFLDIVNTFL